MTGFSENHYLSNDGLRLFYRDYPAPTGRTPVLCIPGLTRNSRDFDFIAGHIAQTRRVLCADLRGRGQSAYDPNWRNYTVPVERDDIGQLLKAAGIPRVIVLGTSRGGIVGMALAASQRESVAGIILNDIGAQLEGTGLQRIMDMVGRKLEFSNWAEAVLALKAANQAAFTGLSDTDWLRFAKAVFRAEKDRIVPDYDLNLGLAMGDGAASSRRTQAEAVNLWPLFGALAGLPALLLRGENSDLLSAETMWAMKGVKADMAMVTVRNRGHVPFLDETEAVDGIDSFLRGID